MSTTEVETALLKKEIEYIKKSLDELNKKLGETNTSIKEMNNSLPSIRTDVNLAATNAINALLKIEKIETRLDVTDSKLQTLKDKQSNTLQVIKFTGFLVSLFATVFGIILAIYDRIKT